MESSLGSEEVGSKTVSTPSNPIRASRRPLIGFSVSFPGQGKCLPPASSAAQLPAVHSNAVLDHFAGRAQPPGGEGVSARGVPVLRTPRARSAATPAGIRALPRPSGDVLSHWRHASQQHVLPRRVDSGARSPSLCAANQEAPTRARQLTVRPEGCRRAAGPGGRRGSLPSRAAENGARPWLRPPGWRLGPTHHASRTDPWPRVPLLRGVRRGWGEAPAETAPNGAVFADPNPLSPVSQQPETQLSGLNGSP